MTQILISAPPRTGKSQYSVYLIDKFSKKYPNRTIYTNIIGINYPGVISISSTISKPFDWRDLPNGAILFYDECHEHPAFSQDDLLKEFQPDLSYLDTLSSLVESQPFDSRLFTLIDEYYENLYFLESLDGLVRVRPDEKHAAAISLVKNGKLPDFLKKGLTEYISKLKRKESIRQKENILDIGRSLTMHGHFGIDIYMITQNVRRVNDAVKAASSKHLILRRMFGWNLCFIFEYPEVQTYFGSSNRKNATRFSIFRYRKNLYKYYVSSEEHNIEKSIPIGLTFLVLLVLCIGIFAYMKGKKIYDARYGDETTQAASVETKPSNTVSSSTTLPNSSTQQLPVKNLELTQADQYHINALIDSCINSQQLTPDQCKTVYDPKVQQERNAALMASTGNHMDDIVAKYDSSKPYDFEYSPSNIQPSDFPRFSNVVVYGGKCYPYSQQGTLMKNISSSDCWRMARGDRPFNYFANGSSSAPVNPQYNAPQTQPQPVQQPNQVNNPYVPANNI